MCPLNKFLLMIVWPGVSILEASGDVPRSLNGSRSVPVVM